MQVRTDKHGEALSVLGFGCMRFPKKGNGIDMAETEREIMEAYRNGVNYFDTAYIYGGSEAALGEIVERNGIRERIKIATKLPQYLVGSRAALDRYLNEQLTRLRTSYVDYYLMHHLTDVAMWEKLKKEDVFAVKMFDGEVCYCSVYADEPPTFFVFDTPYGLHEYLKPHDAGEGTPKEYMEYICLQDHISCAFAAKDMVDLHSAELAKDYAKKNKISMRGKHAYPYMSRDIAGHFPFVIVADFERRYLEDALNAAALLSVILEHNDKGAVGFGKGSTMPLFEYTAKDGDAIKEIEYPPKPEPNYPAPKARKYKKKLPHKGIYECDVVYTPVPAEEIVGVVRSAVPYGVAFMAIDLDIEGDAFYSDLYAGYEKNCESMLEDITEEFAQGGSIPEEIRVVDDRAERLLTNYCYVNGIKLRRVQEFEKFEIYRSYYIDRILDETSDEFDDDISPEEMYNEICDTIRDLSEEQLATMPKEMFEQFMEADILPDDLQAKLRRSRIKRNK
mgnify:CR=1 FL=1